MSPKGFGKTATPYFAGGTSIRDRIAQAPPSIFLDPSAPATGRARLDAPGENPKYPETKHTLKCAFGPPSLLFLALSLCRSASL